MKEINHKIHHALDTQTKIGVSPPNIELSLSESSKAPLFAHTSIGMRLKVYSALGFAFSNLETLPPSYHPFWKNHV